MISYHIDPGRRIVTTRIAGRLSVSDLANHFNALMRDPKFSSDLNALIVAVDDEAVPSHDAVTLFAPVVRAWSKRRSGAKWAFVLPSNAARHFADAALNEIKLTTVTSRCFLSETAALAWLSPPPPAATRPGSAER